jgi:general secretion pathway protein G
MKRPAFRIATLTVIVSGLAIIGGIQIQLIRLNRARYSETRARIAELQDALRQYRADNGYYPTTDQGLSALDNGIWDGDPGMVIPREPLVRLPRDGWGNPYFYESDGDAYVLRSLGPPGSESSRDAVVARSPKSPN